MKTLPVNTMSIITAVALGLVAAACADSGDSGVASDGTAVPHDELSIDLTIGGSDGSTPEYEFGRVSGVTVLPDGRIAVSDAMNHVIRIYRTDGTHEFSFGRKGAGPREFDGPCCVVVDERERLWVRDGGNGRYGIFDIHGDSLSDAGYVRIAHNDANRWAPVTFDADGNLIDIGMRTDRERGVPQVHRIHLDSAGAILREVTLHKVPDDSTSVHQVERSTPGGVAILYAYQPYGPTELAHHSPTGEFAHGLSSRYAVDWRAADGTLIRAVTRDLPQGPRLSTREDSVGAARMKQLSERLGVSIPQLGFSLPSHKAPLRDIFFDSTGRLWVELGVPDGERRRADVYGPDGELERTVSWPATVSLRDGYIHPAGVWGVSRDELDVPVLVKLRGGPAAAGDDR